MKGGSKLIIAILIIAAIVLGVVYYPNLGQYFTGRVDKDLLDQGAYSEEYVQDRVTVLFPGLKFNEGFFSEGKWTPGKLKQLLKELSAAKGAEDELVQAFFYDTKETDMIVDTYMAKSVSDFEKSIAPLATDNLLSESFELTGDVIKVKEEYEITKIMLSDAATKEAISLENIKRELEALKVDVANTSYELQIKEGDLKVYNDAGIEIQAFTEGDKVYNEAGLEVLSIIEGDKVYNEAGLEVLSITEGDKVYNEAGAEVQILTEGDKTYNDAGIEIQYLRAGEMIQ